MYTSAIDVSQWQGVIDWSSVPQPIATIKISGGDGEFYYDSKATINYYQAKAYGKAVGLYHFAGGTSATAEADYFVAGCSPLEQDDVLVLDWEIQHPDPVGWCTAFVNRVHEKTGIWPLIYFNGSTWLGYDWTPVTQNCGVWVAWWGVNPNDDLPVGDRVYVEHQYSSDGSVAGISGRVDMDAWFGTVEQFKKYGYHANTTPAPVPNPEPTPTPNPVPEPTPVPEPMPDPTPTPVPEPTPEPKPPISKKDVLLRIFHTFWQAFLSVFTVSSAGVTAAILNVHSFSEFKSFVLATAVSVGAALFAAVKNTIKYYKENKV